MPRQRNNTINADENNSANVSIVVSNSSVLSFEQQKELIALQAQIKCDEDERMERIKRVEAEHLAQIKRNEYERMERLAQIKRDELQMQLEIARMQNNIKQENENDRQNRNDVFNVVNASKRLFKIDENNVDEYIEMFEKMVTTEGWPIDKWCAIIQPHLIGKAQKAYNELSVEDLSNFEVLKQSILKSYELVPEAYWKIFKMSVKEPKIHIKMLLII